jgi:hypothetical protein
MLVVIGTLLAGDDNEDVQYRRREGKYVGTHWFEYKYYRINERVQLREYVL